MHESICNKRSRFNLAGIVTGIQCLKDAIEECCDRETNSMGAEIMCSQYPGHERFWHSTQLRCFKADCSCFQFTQEQFALFVYWSDFHRQGC